MMAVICLIAGYCFGLFQTGYIYGRMNNIDIRNYGSGNSGTTNALRVLGKKAGIIVFAGDFLKAFIPCMLVRLIFKDKPDMLYLLILCTGFGVILGHNFPFYLKFKGGKGIAAMAGLLVAADLRVTLVCLIVFVVIVAVTRYVSLGSIAVAIIFFAGMFYYGNSGNYGISSEYIIPFFLVDAAISCMAFWKHRTNIKRLINGTENKLWGNKKEKDHG